MVADFEGNSTCCFIAFQAAKMMQIPITVFSALTNIFDCLNMQNLPDFPSKQAQKVCRFRLSLWMWGALSCYKGALDPFLPISRIHFTWLPGKIRRDILEKWTAAHICFKLKRLTYVLRLWRKKPFLEHSLLRAADKNSTKTGNIKKHSAWFDEANLSKDSLTRGGPHRRATQ